MTESNTHSNTTPSDAPADAPADGAGNATDNDADIEQTEEVLGGEAGNTAEKDPADWTTGDEPMTGAQRSYLDTLAREAGETISADLTKAEASEHIDRLQSATGRGDS